MAFPITPKAYWKLEDTSDALGVYTLTNSGVSFVAGKINNCADWGDTTNSKYLQLSSTGTSANWSVSAWVYPTANAGCTFFSQSVSGSSYYKHCGCTTANMSVQYSIGANNYSVIYTGAISSAWHHCVVTYNETTKTFKLYLDNVEVASGEALSTPSTSNNNAVIGSFAHNLTSNQGFKGKIDEEGIWDRVLTTDEISALYNSGNGISDYLTLAGVSYWKLDESSGNASDSVGSNTLTNNNSATYSAGKINNGANFVRSSSQYFSTAMSGGGVLDFTTGNFSVSVWVKLTDAPSSGQVYSILFRASGGYQIYYQNVSGTLRLTTEIGGTYIDNDITLTTGVWNNIVLVRTGTSTAIQYINGVLSKSGSASNAASSSNAVQFGKDSVSGYLNGSLDEVGFWSRALSSSEVTALYNGGAGLQYPFTGSLSTGNFFLLF
jgi:hypothetical protein